MLFCGFQGFCLLLYRCGLSSGGCSGCFSFTLAATHFTRVVWCAAVRQHDYRGFYHGWLCSRGLFLGNSYWLDGNRLGCFGFNHGRLNSFWLTWCLSNWLGGDGHFNRCFYRGLWRSFDNRFDAWLNHSHRLADWQLDHRGNCHFFSNNRLRFFSYHWLDYSRLDCFNGLYGSDFNSCRGCDRSGLFNSCSSAFSLNVGLGFGFSADVAGRDGGGHGQTGC
jgi:hypothetical protein